VFLKFIYVVNSSITISHQYETWYVEQINKATKIKLLELMKVNNPKENNQAKEKNTIVCLPSSVKTTYSVGESSPSVPL
jgi:hypothetical protein